jgi:hypothetical protein
MSNVNGFVSRNSDRSGALRRGGSATAHRRRAMFSGKLAVSLELTSSLGAFE